MLARRASVGNSAWSDSIAITTPSRNREPGPPGTPSITTKTATSATIGWSAPTSGGTFNPTLNTDTYRVERSTTSDFSSGVAQGNTDNTSLTYTGLSPSTTYYFRVRAQNADGQGAYSQVLSFTTDAGVAVPPGAPAAPTETAKTRSSITVSWTAPTTGGSFDASLAGHNYQLEISTQSDFAHSNTRYGTVATSRSRYYLQPATTYYARVRARNNDGYGDWSDSIAITTEAGTLQPPGPPGTPIEVSKTARSFSVSWTAPTTGGAFDSSMPADAYTIQWSEQSDFSGRIGTTSTLSTSINISGLVLPETTYYIRVRARNSDGNGAYSEVLTLTTPADTRPPGAPGRPTYSNRVLSWTAPTTGGLFNPTLNEDSYTLQISAFSDFRTGDSTVSGGTVSRTQDADSFAFDLGSSTRYVRVRANNENGGGDWSGTLQVN